MAKQILSKQRQSKFSRSNAQDTHNVYRRRRPRRSNQSSDVLISAVISTYLLTHLHHVLQRAEYGAAKDGRLSQAENFAQLRKVLCMDAHSMKDASASGMRDKHCNEQLPQKIETTAA